MKKTAWTNSTAVTVDAPISLGAGTTYLRNLSVLVLNGKITLAKDAKLCVVGNLNGDAIKRCVVNGAIDGPEATFFPNQCSGSAIGVEIRGPFVLKEIDCSSIDNERHSYVDFWSTGNKLDLLTSCYGSGVRLRVPDVFASNVAGTGRTRLSFTGWLGETGCGRYYLHADQTFDRLDEVKSYNSKDNRHIYGPCGATTQPVTLTLKATADATSYALLDGAVSLVYDPVGDYTQTLAGRLHTTTGTLDVRGGTLRLTGETRLINATGLTVGPKATLVFDSTIASLPVGGSVKFLEMQSGARFEVTANTVSAFGNAPTTVVRMCGDARIAVASGKSVRIGSLVIDGVPMAATTYTPATLPQLEGGSLIVDKAAPAGTYWTGAGDGISMSSAANWSSGAPAAGNVAHVETNGTRTLTLAAAAGGLTAYNMDGMTTLAAPAGSTTVTPAWDIGRGTTVSVGTGATLAYDGTSGSQAKTDTTLAIHDGGKIDVSGGTLSLANVKGRVRLYGTGSEKGTLAVSSGTVSITPSASEHGVTVENGGLVKLTGGKLDVKVSSNYGHSGLLLRGGTVEASGTAVYLSGDGYGRHLDSGFVDFSGYSTLSNRTDNGVRFACGPSASAGRLQVSFREHARAYFNRSGSACFQINDCSVANTETVFSFESDADHVFGYSAMVGGRYGSGVLNLIKGSITVGAYGLVLGGVSGDDSVASGFAPTGTVNVSGGALILSGNGAGWNGLGGRERFSGGIIVGSGERVTVGNNSRFTGFLNVSGGVVTNTAYLVLGGGQAYGSVRQTGGLLFCQRTWTSGGTYEHDYPAVIGCAGGEGRYELLGGEWMQRNDLYVGGVPLTTLRYMKQGANATYYPKDRHDAKGLLRISGGTLTCERLAYVGADGAGTVEVVGSAATVAFQQDLSLTNGAATVRFVADAAGVSPIAVSRTLTIAPGSKLEVDLRGYQGTEKVKLFSFKNRTGAFADADVTILSDGEARLVYGAKEISAKKVKGMALIIR